MYKMLFGNNDCEIQRLTDERFLRKNVTVSILRLDKLHAIVSGNKLFKLYYYLKEAKAARHQTVLTFGGAYSNHLVAAAYACKASALKSIGIVRGEKPAQLSPTLLQCEAYGMQLKFISRALYNEQHAVAFITRLKEEFGDCMIIPEGGYHAMGAHGASLILAPVDRSAYSHICTAVGTATTLAGLVLGANEDQQLYGYPVLKGMTDIYERLAALTNDNEKINAVHIKDGYHFGGYAKKNETLIDFMNGCWKQFNLPLDFVYTAKLLYGVMEDIGRDVYKPGSHILCIHTGGLQGNNSLPAGTLMY